MKIKPDVEITEKELLYSMEMESPFDTMLEEMTWPAELYDRVKSAQREWQAWADAKAIELKIDPKKLKEARGY